MHDWQSWWDYAQQSSRETQDEAMTNDLEPRRYSAGLHVSTLWAAEPHHTMLSGCAALAFNPLARARGSIFERP